MIKSLSQDIVYKPSSDDTFKVDHYSEARFEIGHYDYSDPKYKAAKDSRMQESGFNSDRKVRDALMKNNGFLKNRPDWSQKLKQTRVNPWKIDKYGIHSLRQTRAEVLGRR